MRRSTRARRRLEKAFYQRCLPLLQYGGVMVLIVPHYVLDDELTGWLSNHFTGLRIYAAADPTFKQVVIFGIRVRRRPGPGGRQSGEVSPAGDRRGQEKAEEIPAAWPWEPYVVLPATSELEHFYRVTLEPEQFAGEIQRREVSGLTSTCTSRKLQPRPPVRELSRWHLPGRRRDIWRRAIEVGPDPGREG